MRGADGMTEDDAQYYAETLEPLQRQVILLCSRQKSWGYKGIAKSLGVNYDDVQKVGHFLKAANLAYISVVRRSDEYAGSAIFLNERGEQVRKAVESLVADKR
jgi:hypothetical protein